MFATIFQLAGALVVGFNLIKGLQKDGPEWEEFEDMDKPKKFGEGENFHAYYTLYINRWTFAYLIIGYSIPFVNFRKTIEIGSCMKLIIISLCVIILMFIAIKHSESLADKKTRIKK